MALLSILQEPHTLLRLVAETVTEFGPDLDRLVASMAETMADADGIGLAAPQVGQSYRIIVVALDGPKLPPTAMVNPTITKADDYCDSLEGCLSVNSGKREGTVRRRKRIKDIYLKPKHTAEQQSASGSEGGEAVTGPNSQSSRCGCEYGGPCTRTTVCSVTSVRDEMQEEIDRLAAELAELRDDPYIGSYRHDTAVAQAELAEMRASTVGDVFRRIAELNSRAADAIIKVKECQAERDALAAELAAERRISLMHATQKDALQAQVAELEMLTTRDDYEALERQVAGMREALEPMALVPVEDFDKQDKPDYPLMGWNEHTIYVRDVLRARAALAGPTRTADQPEVVRNDAWEETARLAMKDARYWHDRSDYYLSVLALIAKQDPGTLLHGARPAYAMAFRHGLEAAGQLAAAGIARTTDPTTAEGTEK